MSCDKCDRELVEGWLVDRETMAPMERCLGPAPGLYYNIGQTPDGPGLMMQPVHQYLAPEIPRYQVHQCGEETSE